MDLTKYIFLFVIVTVSHVLIVVFGQTSCKPVTDPSVLDGNTNMVLVDHVFYSETISLRLCGIRYMFKYFSSYF